MTHVMALIAGPGYPWTYLGAMAAAVVLAYGLVVPTLFGKLPPAAAKAATLALAPVTTTTTAYLTRRLVLPALTGDLELHGWVDWLAALPYLLVPVPIAAAALVLAATGRLQGWWVAIGLLVLHVGMLFAMAQAVPTGHAHDAAAAVLLVRWS